jgi:cyclophilin family peptidyl-prolyl cis-trans isomerase/HEAT repeat protein
MELALEIRNLEFQRSTDSSIFKNYVEDQSVEIRILTADAISKIGSPAHLPVLHKLLTDNEPGVLKKTLFALGQIGDQDSLLTSLIDRDKFRPYQKEIIGALGTSKSNFLLTILLNRLESTPDSIKSRMIEAIAFIAPKNYKNHKIRDYLFDKNTDITEMAAYFYARHPLRSAISYLIRANIHPGSTGDKYRLKALQQSMEKYNIQYLDSTLADSLKFRLIADLKSKSLSWQHRLYELSILRHFQDSLSFETIAGYLIDSNPHLRLFAINAIAKFDTIDAKSTLLQAYQDRDWADKGHIILALSKDNPEMIYSLIQQNLDKGHTYFKQLLLKGLARINNRMSIRQLRQFLLVPNVHLNLTAYNELSKYGYIGYNQTKKLLLSGDMALTSIAAQWIVSHPDFARFDDLSAAYAKFNEPEGVETLMAILQTIPLVASEESNRFLQEVYRNTRSFMIAKQAKESLLNAKQTIPPRAELKVDLFVPEEKIFQIEPIQVTLETSKGNILLELLPEIAPATVSNFVYLAKRGYYNNILFHRVVPDFVVQCGDPRGDGWGGPGYAIPCEYNDLPFKRGTIGMATSGKDTGGSQFFICHSDQPHLNRRYTAFAVVLDGMDIVDNIEIEDKIIKIVIQN